MNITTTVAAVKTTAKSTLSLGFAAWAILTSSACFAGTVLNGSFENNYSDWTTLGLASIETSAFNVDPIEGNNQALIRSADGAVGDDTVANLANFLNIPLSEINAGGRNGFRGSGVKQVIVVDNIGDRLSFSWNFVTSQVPSAAFNDFAFLSISSSSVGGPKSAIFLADTFAAPNPYVGVSFSRQSGYGPTPTEFSFSEAGEYTIGFGVLNANDSSFPSGLLIDNVTLAVPEPTALAGLGLVGLALTLRRRRK